MNMKKIFAVIIAAMVMTILPTTTAAQDSGKKRIEGTWNVLLTTPDGSFQLKTRYTFSAGQTTNDGTVIVTTAFDFEPPVACTTGQRVWRRAGKRDYVVTWENFCFDAATGERFGPVKGRELITLSTSGDEFTARHEVEYFDLDGNSEGVDIANLQGKRMEAEIPTVASDDASTQLMPTRGLRRYLKIKQ